MVKFLLASTMFLFVASLGSASEQVNVTTYYPAPDGQYKTLTSIGQTTLATGVGAQVGIGTTSPAACALLTIVSPNQGLRLPRMSTANRDAISSPQDGLVIFNTNGDVLAPQIRCNGQWLKVGDAGGTGYWESLGGDIHNKNAGDVDIGTGPITASYGKLTVQGSVLVSGTTGATPVSGAGTRLMWVPAKAALRIGTAMGTEWNDGFVGQGSFVAGRNSIAGGTYSVALGGGASAGGNYSVAISYTNTLLISNYAVAIGTESVAVGAWTRALGSPSYAIGDFVAAGGTNSFAIGTGSDGAFILGNPIDNSMMIGTRSSTPTLFIGPSSGGGQGVGIGAVPPAYSLDVAGNVKADAVQTSDARFKTDVHPIGRVLDKLDKIEAVSFRWNKTAASLRYPETTKRNIGIMAQDAEKVFPEIVGDRGPYKSVAYGRLGVLLLQAIKELHAENAVLERKVAFLEREAHGQ